MKRSDMKLRLGLSTSFAVLAALLLVPNDAQAQDIFACYTPSGVVYRVNAPGSPGLDPKLKDDCTGNKHALFSWNEVGPVGPPGHQWT